MNEAFKGAQAELRKLIKGECTNQMEYLLCCKALNENCFHGGCQCVVVTLEAIEDGVCKSIDSA